MVSERVKYARAHLSHRKYIALLARPNWRRRLPENIHSLEIPTRVPHSALKFRPTKRIKIMAQPKFSRKKYESVNMEVHPQDSRRSPGSLNTKTIKRLQDLSLPKKRLFLRRNDARITKINNVLMRIHKSRYQKYRLICNTLQKQAVAKEEKWRRKLRRALSKPTDWQRHKKVLERIAKPKPKFPPAAPLSHKIKGKKYDPERVKMLAQPVSNKSPPMIDPFKVRPGALIYEITDTMKTLAYRKLPRVYRKPLIPGKVKKSALRYTPNEHINKLARHVIKPPGREIDLKENAFGVSPAALKAHCSPIIKALAQPKSNKKKK